VFSAFFGTYQRKAALTPTGRGYSPKEQVVFPMLESWSSRCWPQQNHFRPETSEISLRKAEALVFCQWGHKTSTPRHARAVLQPQGSLTYQLTTIGKAVASVFPLYCDLARRLV
jgi:hypothetical protein